MSPQDKLTEAHDRLVAAAQWLEHARAGECNTPAAVKAAKQLMEAARGWMDA